MTPEDIRLREEMRKLEELNRQRDVALELAKQAQQRSEAERSRGREALANKAQLEARAAQAQAAQLDREIEHRTKALAKDGVDKVLTDQKQRREDIKDTAKNVWEGLDAINHLRQPPETHSLTETPSHSQIVKVDENIKATDATIVIAAVTVAAVQQKIAGEIAKAVDKSEQRVQEAIDKAPPPSQQVQDQNKVLEEVYRKDREAAFAAPQAKQQAAQIQPQREPTLGDRTRALEIENAIRAISEEKVKELREREASAYNKAVRDLGDKYKDDPVKQKAVLAQLEQSRPQLQIATGERIEVERAKADQLIQETLKRENLLAAREANDRAAEKEREAQRLAAKQLEERNRNSR